MSMKERREEIMREWDDIRRAIANGDRTSLPRDWFESVLDQHDEEVERLRADARRWQTIAPMFQGWSLRMDGTAHWVLHGGAIKPRARTVAEAVDAMTPNVRAKQP